MEQDRTALVQIKAKAHEQIAKECLDHLESTHPDHISLSIIRRAWRQMVEQTEAQEFSLIHGESLMADVVLVGAQTKASFLQYGLYQSKDHYGLGHRCATVVFCDDVPSGELPSYVHQVLKSQRVPTDGTVPEHLSFSAVKTIDPTSVLAAYLAGITNYRSSAYKLSMKVVQSIQYAGFRLVATMKRDPKNSFPGDFTVLMHHAGYGYAFVTVVPEPKQE